MIEFIISNLHNWIILIDTVLENTLFIDDTPKSNDREEQP